MRWRPVAAAVVAAALLPAARQRAQPLMQALLVSPVVQPWYVLWLLPLALIAGSPAALAWSWIAGFLYLGVDARLRAITFDLPLWSWIWLAQYACVYGLLAWSFLSGWRRDGIPAVADACRGVLLNRGAAWGPR